MDRPLESKLFQTRRRVDLSSFVSYMLFGDHRDCRFRLVLAPRKTETAAFDDVFWLLLGFQGGLGDHGHCPLCWAQCLAGRLL